VSKIVDVMPLLLRSFIEENEI